MFSVGDAGWSSPVARQAHNLKVAGSNPAPATNAIFARKPDGRETAGLSAVWCGAEDSRCDL